MWLLKRPHDGQLQAQQVAGSHDRLIIPQVTHVVVIYHVKLMYESSGQH